MIGHHGRLCMCDVRFMFRIWTKLCQRTFRNIIHCFKTLYTYHGRIRSNLTTSIANYSAHLSRLQNVAHHWRWGESWWRALRNRKGGLHSLGTDPLEKSSHFSANRRNRHSLSPAARCQPSKKAFPGVSTAGLGGHEFRAARNAKPRPLREGPGQNHSTQFMSHHNIARCFVRLDGPRGSFRIWPDSFQMLFLLQFWLHCQLPSRTLPEVLAATANTAFDITSRAQEDTLWRIGQCTPHSWTNCSTPIRDITLQNT